MGALRFLLAPGAGAPSASPWMQAFARRLSALGEVVAFDYPYMLQGRRLPDPQRVLVEAHRQAFDQARQDARVVLIGKSMGGRMGCHVAVEADTKPLALVCLGYPLIGQNGARREQILLELEPPTLFIQGSRDPMCPLADLQTVRGRMKAKTELYVVEGGDHSLLVSRRLLNAEGFSQDDVDRRIDAAIERFVGAAIPGD